jgi:hypothetical protein
VKCFADLVGLAYSGFQWHEHRMQSSNRSHTPSTISIAYSKSNQAHIQHIIGIAAFGSGQIYIVMSPIQSLAA